MKPAKTIFWVLLYLVTVIPACLSLYFYTQKNLTPAIISSLITLSIYTLINFRNIKILSIVSFFTMLFVSFFMFGVCGARTNKVFSSVLDEKTFMLTLPLLISFLLINSIFWLQTKKGLLKIISIFFIFLSTWLIFVFGTSSPDYHQNFIYTRINISMFLILSIYLIIKKKKLFGILGIFMSIGMLLLSAGLFAQRTYTPGEKEQQEVIAFIDPLAKEMFGYYNQKDYDNFCKYCGSALKGSMKDNPIRQNREALGPYVYFGKPGKVVREVGSYRVEYPIKFQNVNNLMYVTFYIGSISPNSPIDNFSFSDKQK